MQVTACTSFSTTISNEGMLIAPTVAACGTKRTSGNVRSMSAFGGGADIPPQGRYFRFGPRPCENAPRRRMRRIVFSIAFFRKRLAVQSTPTSTKSRWKFYAQVGHRSFHTSLDPQRSSATTYITVAKPPLTPIQALACAVTMTSPQLGRAMQRRELIGLIGGAAAWPLAARAQQAGAMRRVGVLMGYAEDDPEAQIRLAALKQELTALGWGEGRNITTDVRWGAADITRSSVFARELVALQPDVIVGNTTPATEALYRETRTIPIVFVVVSDPVGSGFVQSLPRPGGNITGFINLEGSLVEKWLELIKEIAPETMRVAVLFNPQTAPYADYYLGPLNAAAPRVGVRAFTVAVGSDADIENAIAELGRERGNGIVVMTDSFMTVHRRVVIEQAARYKIPCIYFVGIAATEGGLISYGVDLADQFRRTGQYVDRILRGAKPADLPVQLPTKFELIVNVRTAKALGLYVPAAILLRADRVIE